MGELTWDNVVKLVDELARRVRDSGWRPDVIVAVPRGGLTVAHLLAQRLDIREVATVGVRFTGEEREKAVTYFLPMFMSPFPVRLLLVEDAVDTGRLIGLAASHLSHCDTQTAALVRAGDYRPDYFICEGAIPTMPWDGML